MKIKEIIFIPNVSIEFTLEDVTKLMKCSRHHYDSKCKNASRQGGLIFGIKNIVQYSDGVKILTFREIDLLLKICECAIGLKINAMEIVLCLRCAISELNIHTKPNIKYKEE